MEPVWEAVRFEAALQTGRTKPLLLDCERPGTAIVRRRFVTKAIGLPEVQEFSLCHEFVGARLARLVGLAAPDSAFVNLSPEFLDVSKPDLDLARVKPSAGIGVGSAFVPNLQPFPASANLSEDEVLDASRIYVFDLLVQNADRRAGSPNCGRAEGRIVPFDFENAFGFRFALASPEPWRVSGLLFARQHLFHQALRQYELPWAEILAPFADLTPAAVAALCSTVPTAWRAIGAQIQSHIQAALLDRSRFGEQVAASLGEMA